MADTANVKGPSPYSVVMLYQGPDKAVPLSAPWSLPGEGMHFERDNAHSRAAKEKHWSPYGKSAVMCVVNVYPKPPKPVVPFCAQCGDSKIELVNGGNGNVLEVPCSYCQPYAPFAPVTLKPGEVHCPVCKGSGLWATGMDDIPCHDCKGSGIIHQTRTPNFGLFGSEVPPEN